MILSATPLTPGLLPGSAPHQHSAVHAQHHFSISQQGCFQWTSDTNRKTFLPAMVNNITSSLILFFSTVLYCNGTSDTLPRGYWAQSKVCEPWRAGDAPHPCTASQEPGQGTFLKKWQQGIHVLCAPQQGSLPVRDRSVDLLWIHCSTSQENSLRQWEGQKEPARTGSSDQPL